MVGSAEAPATNLAGRVEQRLTVPVIIAAVASVPATFLTMLDGAAEQVGTAVNYASLAVLTGESAVLLLLAGDRLRWLREHWFMVAIAVAAVPAVLLALGPVQVLRLLRFVGALRIIRVRRIIRAGRILRQRAGLTDWRWRVAVVALSVLSAGFVALVLSDPSSTSRELVEDTAQRFGVPAVVAAGLILGAATFVVARYRGAARSGPQRPARPQPSASSAAASSARDSTKNAPSDAATDANTTTA